MKTLSDLRKFMNETLSLSELQILCFDLAFDYENLPGETKNKKIIETIKQAHHLQKLVDLIDWLASERAGMLSIDWPEVTRTFVALQQYNIASAEFEGESRLPAPFQSPPPLPYFIKKQEYFDLLAAVEQDSAGTVRSSGLIGSGKTAIANQISHTLRDRFPDGVIWIRAHSNDLETDLRQTAVAFGQTEAFSQQVELKGKIEFIRRLLAPKNALVVVDGVDRADDISYLLLESRNYFTLITTQDRMLLKNFALQEIAVSTFNEEETVDYLAYFLGEDRVAAEPEAVRRLHHLLGGLPLALNIVGGMLSESLELTIDEYNQMLADEGTRLEGLTDWISGANSISASFELSYQTLPEQLQALYRSLTVFRGLSFSSQAVAAVSEASLPQVKLGLGRLARLSLLQYDEKVGRYRINSLVHSFAVQKCGSEYAQFQGRAASYYLSMLEAKDEPSYERTLQEEWANLLGVFEYLYQQKDWPRLSTSVLHLTQFELGAMGFLEKQGHWQEARRLLDRALEAHDSLIDEKLVAQLRLNAMGFALLQNDKEAAQKQLDLVESLLPDLMDDDDLWNVVHWYDLQARMVLQEDPSLAVDQMKKCLAVLEEKPMGAAQVPIGYVYSRLVPIFGRLGRLDDAESTAIKARALLPETASPALISLYNNFDIIYRLQGKLEASREAGRKALAYAEAFNDINRLPMLWNNLGLNQQVAGELKEALTQYTRSRSLAQRIGNHYFYCGSVLSLGQVYLMLGDDLLAAQTLEEARSAAQTQEFQNIEALILSNLIDLHLIDGALDQANEELSTAMEIVEKLEMGYLLPTLIRQQAQLFTFEDRQLEALAQIDEAIALAIKSQDKLEEGISYRIKGEILSYIGRYPEASDAYQESETILRDLHKYEWARTLLSRVDHLSQGEKADSQFAPILQRANEVFTQMETRREIERVEVLLP